MPGSSGPGPSVFLIGVAGPSCSGKTELARWLSARLGAPVLNLDLYYTDLAHLPLEERAKTNFDEPASMDQSAIFADAAALAQGKPIRPPSYDFATHSRTLAETVLEPSGIVILEGLFALFWPDLRSFLQLKVYVDAPDEVCLARRLERDVRERGRTPESVHWQFETTVKPMARKHILPTRSLADVVVSGTDPIELSGNRVLPLVRS